MDKAHLLSKQQDLKAQFDKLTSEKNELVQHTEAVDAELFRLQGDFRTLESLIKDFKVTEVLEKDTAKTITAKAKK